MPSAETFSQNLGLDQHGLLGRLLAVEDAHRERHAGAADRAGIGHRRALQALDRVELADEAGVVGADDRHHRRAALDEGVDDDVVDARGPDAVHRQAGGEIVEDLLLALVLLPAGEGLLRDLDVRELGERALEAGVAVGIGRGAGGAAHVDDVALAAEGLEEPLGAEVGVFLLVVRDDEGGGVGHRLVDGDDGDALLGGLGERGRDAGGVGGVDDDGVDAGGDQVAEILELAGGVGVAVGDVEARDLAGGQRLRLHRADHLLAPAVALHGVGDADGVAVGGHRGRAEERGGERKRGEECGSHGFFPPFGSDLSRSGCHFT